MEQTLPRPDAAHLRGSDHQLQGGKALIITDGVIETRAYNEESADVTWESCTLRGYLNGDFYNALGDDQEKAIVETKNANSDNPEHATAGGNGTAGKVFCLSIDEANKYFSSDDDRVAEDEGKASPWWFRSTGRDVDRVPSPPPSLSPSVSGLVVMSRESSWMR